MELTAMVVLQSFVNKYKKFTINANETKYKF